eukprot:50485_1
MLTSDQTALPIVADHQFIVQSSKLKMKLTHILDQMGPDKFQMIYDCVDTFADTAMQMNVIIALVMYHAIKRPELAKQYAELCQLVHAYTIQIHSSKQTTHQWILNDTNIDQTLRAMIITETNVLFDVYVRGTDKTKANVMAVMVLVAELYNIGIIHKAIVFKGVCDQLLPPKNNNLTSLDLEGLCCLLKHCGKKLDGEAKKYVDRYVQKISTRCTDSRMAEIVKELNECRKNVMDTETVKYKGRCKTFYPLKRFGFILVNDGSGLHGDVFVHCSEISAQGFNALVKGETVEFQVLAQDDGRRKAIKVTALNETRVDGNGVIEVREDKRVESPKEVHDWLRKMGKMEYLNAFVENGFDDMNAIKLLTKDHLRQIGVTKLGHVEVIWREAQKIN